MSVARMRRGLSWDDRMPMLRTLEERQIMLRRLRQCAPEIEHVFKLQEGDIQGGKVLGHGYYGIVVEPPKRKSVVVKITADNLEANTCFHLSKQEKSPKGVVKVYGVVALGDRSTVDGDKMPFVHFHGDGRARTLPYRPLWVIVRESLVDGWDVVKLHGKRRGKLQQVLEWLEDYIDDLGHKRLQIGRKLRRSVPVRDVLRSELDRYYAGGLMEALEWFVDQGIVCNDVSKISNLGWRNNFGLAARDPGASEAIFDRLDQIPVIAT